jgi:hypothetical protein
VMMARICLILKPLRMLKRFFDTKPRKYSVFDVIRLWILFA